MFLDKLITEQKDLCEERGVAIAAKAFAGEVVELREGRRMDSVEAREAVLVPVDGAALDEIGLDRKGDVGWKLARQRAVISR